MIRSLALLAASLLAYSASQGQSATDEIHLRATVQDVVLLSHFSGKIIPVDFDPRFALTLRIESVVPPIRVLPSGLLRHSPSTVLHCFLTEKLPKVRSTTLR